MDMATAIVALTGIFATFGLPLGAWYVWMNRPAARNQLPGSRGDSQLEARLERIETAVQAIAVETERISEGQRFTTKLLSDSRIADPQARGTVDASADSSRPV